ncbi:MAG TPA: hypothetical protein VH391_01620 [Solirubrobacterales bacterium]|jgi:hypothetical protein
MHPVRQRLPFLNSAVLLLTALLLAGAVFILSAGSPGRTSTLVFAALWAFLGIRIWVKWGWEERFSIPACFVLSILTLTAGYGSF